GVEGIDRREQRVHGFPLLDLLKVRAGPKPSPEIAMRKLAKLAEMTLITVSMPRRRVSCRKPIASLACQAHEISRSTAFSPG
ncbi:MAG: hypothetical protein WAL10_26855, partial [Acetobacteraceae bacterium]